MMLHIKTRWQKSHLVTFSREEIPLSTGEPATPWSQTIPLSGTAQAGLLPEIIFIDQIKKAFQK